MILPTKWAPDFSGMLPAVMIFDISTWYSFDVSVSLELMDSFVKGIEEQAVESAQKYEKHKETEVVGEYDEESVLVYNVPGS